MYWYTRGEYGIPEYDMKKEKLSIQIYKKIKNDLLYLKILPDTVLQEREIANIFSVSRTPIREAIQRLAIEGWVEINSRKSIVIKPIREQDVIEIFEFRRIIEPMVLDIILEKRLADLTLINNIQDILSAMKSTKDNTAEFIDLDQNFHALIIHKINNKRLNQAWGQLKDEIIRLGMIAMQRPGRFANVVQEHQRIIDALVDMKKLKARKSCLDHLYSTEDIILESIFSKGGK